MPQRPGFGFGGLVGANPVDLDAGRIELGAGAGSTTQDGSGVEYALFIEVVGASPYGCPCRGLEQRGLFIVVAMAHQHDVVVAAGHSRSSFVDQDALAAVVDAGVVLGEDHISEPHELRRAVDSDLCRLRSSLAGLGR